MKLYMFEHCSLCFQVRMVAALKRLHMQEVVVLNDDTDTMVALVGTRTIPILVRDNDQPMLESMDMVRYVDSHGDRVLTGPERAGVAAWAEQIVSKNRATINPCPQSDDFAAPDRKKRRRYSRLKGDPHEAHACTRIRR